MLGAAAVTVRVRVHHIGHRLSLLEASELPDRNRQTPSQRKQADDEITEPPEIELGDRVERAAARAREADQHLCELDAASDVVRGR
jgi:hypothetical protein